MKSVLLLLIVANACKIYGGCCPQVIMGTGIVTNLFLTTPHRFKGLRQIAMVFFFGNWALFALFSLLTVLRYTLYPQTLALMLRHQVQCLFSGAIPMALATLTNATIFIAVPAYGYWAIKLAEVLFWVDVFLTLLSIFGIPILMFHIHTLSLDKMTAVWLLPVVPAIVVSVTGALVAQVSSPDTAAIIIVTSYILWGMGIALAIIILTLYFHRLAIHCLPNSEVIVSAFVPLGPLGQGTYGILQLAVACEAAHLPVLAGPNAVQVIRTISIVTALVMWGFGLWWLVHGATSVWIRAVWGNLKVTMAFWGLIFPLGVFTAATGQISVMLTSKFFSYLASVFLVLLTSLWLFCAFKTVEGVLTQPVLRPPCLSKLQLASSYERADQDSHQAISDDSSHGLDGTVRVHVRRAASEPI